MSLLTKELNIFFSSDENSGAENVSADGSRFSVILDNITNKYSIKIVDFNYYSKIDNINEKDNNTLTGLKNLFDLLKKIK